MPSLRRTKRNAATLPYRMPSIRTRTLEAKAEEGEAGNQIRRPAQQLGKDDGARAVHHGHKTILTGAQGEGSGPR
jgi:hypothetical protein